MSLQIAGNILQRAVELDNNKRYTESLVCYQEGLQVLINVLKESSGEQRSKISKNVEQYMKRAEEIKRLIQKFKSDGNFHEQIHVEHNSTGHSYQSVFGRFLDNDVETVKVEDPYIKVYHQCQNLLRLCELLIKNCNKLTKIEVLTTKGGSEQETWLNDIKSTLQQHNVHLSILYSETLHDRQITLSTGWIIKIGRGLDYFKAPETKFSLGVFDLDFRLCHETTIDIFHSNSVNQS